MLDATELARRLRAAMDTEPKVSSAALAERCGVTPQAVHGWRTTGRVAKGHLPVIAELTRKPIEFFLEATPGATRATRAAWQSIEAAGKAAALFLAVPGVISLCSFAKYSACVLCEIRRWSTLPLIPPAANYSFAKPRTVG